MKHLLSIIIVIFFILYFIATLLYPGGHHLDYEYEGFSWINNYWCDLYAEKYYNDRPNPSMGLAIGATILVAIGLGHFFYIYPKYIKVSPIWSKLIKGCGLLAALSMIPVFTEQFHNVSIIMASAFGVIVLIGVMKSIWKNKMYTFLRFAWICLFLIILTNGMYYGKLMINCLPLIQKITFAVVLVWLIALNLSFGEELSAA